LRGGLGEGLRKKKKKKAEAREARKWEDFNSGGRARVTPLQGRSLQSRIVKLRFLIKNRTAMWWDFKSDQKLSRRPSTDWKMPLQGRHFEKQTVMWF
jgi:hypothetical protein